MNLLGVGSGLDLTSIIDQMMEIERIPITRYENKRGEYTSMQSLWRELNTRLSALSNSLNGLKLQSDFDKMKVTSADEAVVTATANANVVQGNYKVKVIQLAKAEIAMSEKVDPEDAEELLQGEIRISINGKVVVLEETEEPRTLLDVAKAINKTEDIGVVATVVDGRLVLEAKNTNEEIKFFEGEEENAFLKQIGLLKEEGEGYKTNILQERQGSIIELNGITIARDKNVIDDAVEGLKLTLKKETNEAVNLSVAADVDSIIAKVKAFVDEYKKVQAYFDTHTSFTKGADGESNNTGKLFGDSTISNLKSRLRSMVTGVVEGLPEDSIKMLSQVGIQIDRSGNMTLDESKLREVLTEKPDQVKELFTKPETGLTARLQEFIKGYTTSQGIIDGKINYLADRIKDANKSIERLEARLEMRKESLIRQYTALDSALASLYSQGDWLATQLTLMTNQK